MAPCIHCKRYIIHYTYIFLHGTRLAVGRGGALRITTFLHDLESLSAGLNDRAGRR